MSRLKALPRSFAITTAMPFAITTAIMTLVLAGVTLITTSCTSSNAQARFINAISDSSGSLDIEMDGTRVFQSVSFASTVASAYKGVPSGTVMIEGLQAGGNTVAFPSQNITLKSGGTFTLVAAGSLSGTVNILTPVDINTQPAVNTTNFRVINASTFGPGGGGNAADVYILPNPVVGNLGNSGNPITFSDLSYGATSGYTMVTDNSQGQGYTLYVTLAGNPTPYFSYSLGQVGSSTEGAICTLVLTDQLNGSSMSTTPVKLNDLNCGNL